MTQIYSLHIVPPAEAIVWRCSVKKVLLKFRKINRKTPVPACNFIKKETQPAILFKKRLWHMCLSVNFVKFLRTPFLQNTSGGFRFNRQFFYSFNNFYCINLKIETVRLKDMDYF